MEGQIKKTICNTRDFWVLGYWIFRWDVLVQGKKFRLIREEMQD